MPFTQPDTSSINLLTDVGVPLGSALLGAVVGAFATSRATNKTLKHEREDAARERVERRLEDSAAKSFAESRFMGALASEIEENIIAGTPKDVLIASFATDAWSRAREVSRGLPSVVYDPLQAAYAAAASFNSKWDWAKSIQGMSMNYNPMLQSQSEAVVKLFERARGPLLDWLEQDQ